MATLYEKITNRWQATLNSWKNSQASPEELLALVENTLPAIIREEVIETAKERWYAVMSSLEEAHELSEDEFALVSKEFAEKVYQRLQVELDKFVADFISNLLVELREISQNYRYRYESLQRYWNHRLEEEKSAVESAVEVDRRKFVNLIMNQLLEDLKNRLERKLLAEADIYAHYVKRVVGNRNFDKVVISGFGSNVADAFIKEFGADKVEVLAKEDEKGVWIVSGASKWDFSPGVVVNEVISENLPYIRKILYGEGSK